MRMISASIFLAIWAVGARAQPLDLRGRVVQANGLPVPGAWVGLASRGISAKTADDGTFAFSGSTGLGRGVEGAPRYRIHPGVLLIDVPVRQEIRVDFLDLRGRAQGGLRRILDPGPQRVELSGSMPGPGRTPGLAFLRVRVAGTTRVHPYAGWGQDPREAVIAPQCRSGPAAKRVAAAADTLRIFQTGFRDYAKPITGFAEGDLGDLTLTPGEGSVCLKQRSDTAGGGSLFCGALFDQDPRVHLPASLPGTAYAAASGDAFVAIGGGPYPLPPASELGPEMRRHASVLYEIKIQDGKVAAFRPAVVFDEALFLAPLMGRSFEGSISKRLGTGRFEGIPTLPVRVRISAERYQGSADPASPFQLKAGIANLASGVTAADGSCMPALSASGSQAPFPAGAEVILPVGRVQSMHGYGDDEFVFELYAGDALMGSLMARQWFFGPLDLVKGPLVVSGAYAGVGHGSPGTIPYLELKPVDGGGAPCAGN
jgi:hypothetical protein